MKTMLKLATLLSVFVLVLTGCSSKVGTVNLKHLDKLTIAIAPTNDPETVQKAADLWTKELTPIFKDMGYDFDLDIVIATDASAITEGVNSGQMHLGFVPGSSYVIAKDVHGDGINVIMQGTRYDVNKDGSKNPKTIAGDYDSALYINSKVYKEKGMKDWSNKQLAEWVANGESKIATSSYTSGAGFVWPVNFVLDNDQDPEKINWQKTDNHFSSIQGVADGNYDACFAYFGVNNDVATGDNANYKDINKTTTIALQNVGKVRIPNDVAIASGTLDKESQDAIFTAFETMAKTDSGKEALSQAYSWIGVKKVDDSNPDWAVNKTYLDAVKAYNK